MPVRRPLAAERRSVRRLRVSAEHQFAISHFDRMAKLTRAIEAVPALVLEAGFSYSSFGSWWFSFLKEGWHYRIAFDGREGTITLESGGRRTGGRPPDWVGSTSRSVGVRGDSLSEVEILDLVRRAAPVEGSAV